MVKKSPGMSARRIKIFHPETFGDVSVRLLQHHLLKDCNLPSRHVSPPTRFLSSNKFLRTSNKTLAVCCSNGSGKEGPPQSKSQKMSQEKKAFALGMLKSSKSQANVARLMEVSCATIERLVAKAKLLGEFEIPKRKVGTRPSNKISLMTQLQMKRIITRYPTMSARKLKMRIPALNRISIRCIQDTLKKELNLPSRRPAKKPMLTQAMKEKRLAFAREHQHWTVADWSRVHFTDESTFRIVRSCGSQMVRRSPGSNRYASKFTVKTVKHAASVMALGGFSAAGRGELHFLEKGTTMNSDRYMAVLAEHCFPFMIRHGSTILLQDSAPCHVSKATKAFIAAEGPAGIQLIKWPGNSPDCNPIENLWHIIKCKLQDMDTSSLPKLVQAIKMVWRTGISAETIQHLVESMPRRIQMVIEAEGEMTKY